MLQRVAIPTAQVRLQIKQRLSLRHVSIQIQLSETPEGLCYITWPLQARLELRSSYDSKTKAPSFSPTYLRNL